MAEKYDYGPLISYEIIWRSGHVETIRAHQVQFESMGFSFRPDSGMPPRIIFHGEVGGRWQLILAVPEADIASVRNVSETEDRRP